MLLSDDIAEDARPIRRMMSDLQRVDTVKFGFFATYRGQDTGIKLKCCVIENKFNIRVPSFVDVSEIGGVMTATAAFSRTKCQSTHQCILFILSIL